MTAARARAAASSGGPASQAADEKPLVDGMRRLFAVVEGYPELKASEHFLALQKELANTEDRIQAARRFYNANVRDLNTRIEVFPVQPHRRPVPVRGGGVLRGRDRQRAPGGGRVASRAEGPPVNVNYGYP